MTVKTSLRTPLEVSLVSPYEAAFRCSLVPRKDSLKANSYRMYWPVISILCGVIKPGLDMKMVALELLQRSS